MDNDPMIDFSILRNKRNSYVFPNEYQTLRLLCSQQCSNFLNSLFILCQTFSPNLRVTNSIFIGDSQHLDRETGWNRYRNRHRNQNRIESIWPRPGQYFCGFLEPGSGRNQNRWNRQKPVELAKTRTICCYFSRTGSNIEDTTRTGRIGNRENWNRQNRRSGSALNFGRHRFPGRFQPGQFLCSSLETLAPSQTDSTQDKVFILATITDRMVIL